MWLRAQVDITYGEIARLALRSVFPLSRRSLHLKMKEIAGGHHVVLGTSVRSLLSVLLEELAWAEGSVVACSAVNIPQMEHILRSHKLVPQAIDIDASKFFPDQTQIREVFRRFTPLGYLHASYFGGRNEEPGLRDLAQASSVYTIDDRSQCFSRPDETEFWAEVTLFSLGPYKSPTAAGGAIAVFQNERMAEAVRGRVAALRQERTSAQLLRLLKLSLIKLQSIPMVMQAYCSLLRIPSEEHGDYISNRIRRVADIDDVNGPRLRTAPSRALSSCVIATAERFRPSRYTRRIEIARFLARHSHKHVVLPGTNCSVHSHWLIPMISRDPEGLLRLLRKAGFDAARMAKTLPVGGTSPEALAWNAVATKMLNALVLLPSDTRMPNSEVARLSRLINQHEALNDRS